MAAGLWLVLALVYGAFLLWYGGKGRPLAPAELEDFLQQLQAADESQGHDSGLAEVRELMARDDGCEFVMHNLVQHRARALYPAGHPDARGGDQAHSQQADRSAAMADRRYGRAIIWPLLRNGNLPVFIGKRIGRFIDSPGDIDWHYVAMVRYRSRRDFLRFALLAARNKSFVHKWAAIERTHVFPLKPMVSFVFVRGAVGTFVLLVGLLLSQLLK